MKVTNEEYSIAALAGATSFLTTGQSQQELPLPQAKEQQALSLLLVLHLVT